MIELEADIPGTRRRRGGRMDGGVDPLNYTRARGHSNAGVLMHIIPCPCPRPVGIKRGKCRGNARSATSFWLMGAGLAVLVVLGSNQLWTSLLGLAAINACGFFVFLEWLEQRDRG